MKRLVRVFLAGTAITLGFGQIVSAADLPVKAPVAPVAAPDWTGFYIGLNTGGSIGTGSASQNAAFNSAAIGANGLLNGSDRSSPSGGVFGGQLGYNKQISNWVVGLEADWQWTSQKANSLNCTPPAATVGFFGAGASGFGYCLDAEQKLTNFGTARARAGVLSNNWLLWYLTGGLAWGTVKDTLTFTGSANSTIFPGGLQPGPFLPASASFSTTKVGWTLGAGVETKLGGGWSAKLEYLFVDLGSVTGTMGITINPAFGPSIQHRGSGHRHKNCASHGQHRARRPQLQVLLIGRQKNDSSAPDNVRGFLLDERRRTINVRYWHKADPSPSALHMSAFDPKRTSDVFFIQ